MKLVIAKPGFDALTETNPDNLIFSSDYATLRYFASGNHDITIVGDGTAKSTQHTIVHGLGYIPFFIVYVNDFVSGSARYSITPYINSVLGNTREAYAWADENNLYLKMFNYSMNTYTAKFYYKIFRNNTGL